MVQNPHDYVCIYSEPPSMVENPHDSVCIYLEPPSMVQNPHDSVCIYSEPPSMVENPHDSVCIYSEPPSMVENPPAEITQPLANTETLQLTCRVRGRPTPSVQWFKDNDTVSVTTLYPDFYSIEQIDETTDQYSSQIKSILTFRGRFLGLTSPW